MKHLRLLTLLVPALTTSIFAGEIRKLDARDLSSLDAKPTGTATQPPALPPGVTAKGFVTKSARPSPPTDRVEKSRTYSSKGSVVTKGTATSKSAVARVNAVRIDFTDGTFVEQPFVEVPLLFRVGTAELLDSQNLEPVIAKVRSILDQETDARFRVEGHASAEGDGALNERLARDRAEVIQQTLAEALATHAGCIRPEGRGSRDANAPATAPESQLQQDRKVLVVREK